VRLMASMVLAAFGLMAAPATTAVADPVPPACTPPVQITDLAFDPPEVTAGDATTATLVVQNCSPDPEPVTATWLGRFIGPASGIPAGTAEQVNTASGYSLVRSSRRMVCRISFLGEDCSVIRETPVRRARRAST